MLRGEYHQRIRTHLGTAYLLSEEKIDTVLPRFLDSLNTLMLNLESISETEANEAISKAGHAIKGALLNLGLPDLAERAFMIEKKCKLPDVEWDCSQVIADLKKEIAKII